MKFLLVARQERHAAAYVDALKALAERGHAVALAVQESDGRALRAGEASGANAVRVATCPPSRIDEWGSIAALARKLRDYVHYLRPQFTDSPALRLRFLHRLRQEMDLGSDADATLAALGTLPLLQIERILTVLALAERGIPTSRLFDEFLRSEAPDVLLVCPLLHLGSSQADVVASARRLGIPVWMLLFSWDNLSTKGSIYVEPDLLFVWNEQQRDEAERLHGFPPARTVVVGAPRFDSFFARRPELTGEQFLAPLGLDPKASTILYLCSSLLVSPDEIPFVRRWLGTLRESRSEILRGANVVIRPHPSTLLPADMRFQPHQWPAAPRIEARVARPFDDSRAVVVETQFDDPAGLYESLVHSQAVVALNTTAELEAGIVGRPVFTIRPEAAEDGDHQATLHFHYLTREHGGFVSAAPDLGEHVRQLERALTAGEDLAEIRSFIASFLRPHGLDRAVLPLLVNALEASAATVSARAEGPTPDPAFDQPSGRSEGPRLVPLGESASTLTVHATPEALSRLTDDGAVRLDAGTMKWLNRQVHTGEVLYDINANFGPYALIAAVRRGARVVAFEPGHRAYGALCDNLLLNHCQGAVIPVPLPLAGQDGLADGRNQQPYCWSRLDTIVDRYQLPPASHMRLSASASPFDVLDGAERTVAGAALRTIWLEVLTDQQPQMEERLLAHGFTLQKRRERRKTVGLLFARQ